MGRTAPLTPRPRLYWVLLAPLMLTTMMIAAKSTSAQSADGTVRLLPAISSVDADSGAFGVFIVVEDLNHHGQVFYDDNRDTVPDREVDSVGMAAFEFTIEFDETVVSVEHIEPGPVLTASNRSFQCLPPRVEPGSVRFGCLSTSNSLPGLQGELTLASVTLTPLRAGSSPLLLTSQLSGPLGDPVRLDVVGGLVRVTGDPPPVPTSSPTLATDTPGPNATTTTGTATAQSPTGGASPAPATPTVAGTPAATGTAVSETGTPTPSISAPDDDGNENGAVTLWILVGLGGLTAAGLAAGYLRRRMTRRKAS